METGCSHDIVNVLRNWPGTKPGFLIVDALDAARTDAGAKTFRDLIGALTSVSTRWRVIISIRKYDLRYSQPLQSLFSGTPPSKFCDPEFKSIRHVETPVLSDSELDQVKLKSNELSEIIQNANADLRLLLRIPFNLKLVAELISNGVDTRTLTPIRSQIELLERYWQERVIGSDTIVLSLRDWQGSALRGLGKRPSPRFLRDQGGRFGLDSDGWSSRAC